MISNIGPKTGVHNFTTKMNQQNNLYVQNKCQGSIQQTKTLDPLYQYDTLFILCGNALMVWWKHFQVHQLP